LKEEDKGSDYSDGEYSSEPAELKMMKPKNLAKEMGLNRKEYRLYRSRCFKDEMVSYSEGSDEFELADGDRLNEPLEKVNCLMIRSYKT
jgi:hypothetical protein